MEDPQPAPEEVSPQAETVATPAAAGAAPSDTATRPGVEPVASEVVRPGTRVGGYLVEDVLGKGGMGTVFRARHLELGRQIALKVVTEVSESRLARFQREARAVANLRHPNIVTLYEVGRWNGQPFLAMELLEGEELGTYIAREPSLQIKVGLLAQACFAVEEAHSQGVMHRDLKPSNLLVQADPLCVKILDFGLASSTDGDDDALTRTGDVVGTPAYMSPEQAEGRRDIDTRSDVYALGAILYEILTERRPFVGPTPVKVLHAILHDDVDPPHLVRADVPPALSRVCLKAMAKDREERYATAAELGEDLLAWLEGRPITARGAPLWLRAVRAIKKHRQVSLMTLLLVTIAVLLLTLGRNTAQAIDAEARIRAEGIARSFVADLGTKLEIAESNLSFLERTVATQCAGVTMELPVVSRPDLEERLALSLHQFLEINPWIFGTSVAFRPFLLSPDEEQVILYKCRTPDGIERRPAPPDYDYLTENWYVEPLRRGEGCWSAPFFDAGLGERWMVTHSRPLVHGLDTLGVVTVDIAVEALEKSLEAFPMPRGYAFLLDASGQPVSIGSRGLPATPEALREQLPALQLEAEMPELLLFDDPFLGEEALVVHLPVETTGWRAVLVIPRTELME